MPKLKPIRVMLSSRCNDQFQFQGNARAPLSDTRIAIKGEIESARLFGDQVFEVWINEDAPAASLDEHAFEHCLKQARDCDLFACLYNGNAGWGLPGGNGICHAELLTAHRAAPAKVRVIQICDRDDPDQGIDYGTLDADARRRNRLFQAEVKRLNAFSEHASDGEAAIQCCRKAIKDALRDLVNRGSREAQKGKYYLGEALDWSRLALAERRSRMTNVLVDAISAAFGGRTISGGLVRIKGENTRILVRCDAIAGPLTMPAARELVGQPFVFDYEHLANDKRSIGPLHIIGCHRGVTEPQALRLLGSPDVTVVRAPFGVFLADEIHKVQIILLAECRDEPSTREAVRQLFDWLGDSGERERLEKRAASRANIVRAIANERSSAQ